eukprot:233548_1
MSQKQANIGLSLDQSGTLFAPKKQSMDSLGSIIKSPRAPTPRTPITTREAIDTLKLKLTQANDLQHLFEKYMQQIDTHVSTVQANIDKQFDEIKKEMRKRKNILKQQVEAWKHDKLVSVANEIETAGKYEDILLKAQKQCDTIIKNDKLNEKQKSQQLKQIKSHLKSGLSNVNILKFKTYNDSKQLAEYINNFTTLIDIKYQQNISITQLSNYGEIKTNFKNSFLCVPILNLLQPIKGRESKNGYKMKLKTFKLNSETQTKKLCFVCHNFRKIDLMTKTKKERQFWVSEKDETTILCYAHGCTYGCGCGGAIQQTEQWINTAYDLIIQLRILKTQIDEMNNDDFIIKLLEIPISFEENALEFIQSIEKLLIYLAKKKKKKKK